MALSFRPLWIGWAVLANVCAAAPAPDVVLTGTVSFADLNQYLEIPFTVPPGIARVTVDFTQQGAGQRTTIDLGVADPDRLRGWSGGNKSHVTLAETDATPSYLPGAIPAGIWHLLLGIPNIRAGVETPYRAEIRFGREGEAPILSHFSDAPLKSGPAWYRGDLHMHSGHSDGTCLSRSGVKIPCPVFRTIEKAEARGLDFIALSDHNTVSQSLDLRELQPFFDRTLLIPGRELTTFSGHANALGTIAPIDFRIDGKHVPDGNGLADRVHRVGGLFSINHPTAPSGEICMGCGWEAKDFDFAKADAVEVVNGGAIRGYGGPSDRALGLAFWRGLLQGGYSPTAVGGSDNHDSDLPLDDAGSVGAPTTVVFAENLSERAILDGLKHGHVFIDIAGSRDRLVDLTAETKAGTARMGDHIVLAPEATVTIHLHVVGLADGHVSLISDGGALPGLSEDALAADDSRSLELVVPAGQHWLYAEIRDKNGQLALISNPIYGSAPPKAH